MQRGGSGVACGIVSELRGRGVKRVGLRGEKSYITLIVLNIYKIANGSNGWLSGCSFHPNTTRYVNGSTGFTR